MAGITRIALAAAATIALGSGLSAQEVKVGVNLPYTGRAPKLRNR